MKLESTVFGATFQNPILLASGTCGYGEELDDLFDIDRLGGMVTKAVTIEPRTGNPSPRVAEFAAGMLNSIGLANVGLQGFRSDKLPWLQRRLSKAHVLINVAGKTIDEFASIIGAGFGERIDRLRAESLVPQCGRRRALFHPPRFAGISG